MCLIPLRLINGKVIILVLTSEYAFLPFSLPLTHFSHSSNEDTAGLSIILKSIFHNMKWNSFQNHDCHHIYPATQFIGHADSLTPVQIYDVVPQSESLERPP